jgi:hypothetical protein
MNKKQLDQLLNLADSMAAETRELGEDLASEIKRAGRAGMEMENALDAGLGKSKTEETKADLTRMREGQAVALDRVSVMVLDGVGRLTKYRELPALDRYRDGLAERDDIPAEVLPKMLEEAAEDLRAFAIIRLNFPVALITCHRAVESYILACEGFLDHAIGAHAVRERAIRAGKAWITAIPDLAAMIFPPLAIPTATYQPVIETVQAVMDKPNRRTQVREEEVAEGNDRQVIFRQDIRCLTEDELPYYERVMKTSVEAVEEEGEKLNQPRG